MAVSSELILEFLNDYYSGYSLDHVMQTLYKFFGNPCALYDTGYEAITAYGDGDMDDQIWSETVRDGFLSDKTVSSFIADKLLTPQHQLLVQASDPTIYKADEHIVRRLAITITSEGKNFIGWLVIFEFNHSFTETDFELSRWAAKVLAPHIESYLNKKSFSFGKKHTLMLDILNETRSKAVIENRLRLMGWHTEDICRLLVIKASRGDISEPIQAKAVALAKDHMDDIIWFNYNGSFAMILNGMDQETQDNVFVELEQLLRPAGLSAGVSASIRNITDLRQYYAQADACIRIGRSQNNRASLHLFETHSIEILILMASEHFDVTEFCHPFIYTVHNYDQEFGTEYLDSLRKYALHNGNLKAAAQDLGIHRNTLSYRIEKTAELLHLDDFNEELLSVLKTSFSLYDVLDLCK